MINTYEIFLLIVPFALLIQLSISFFGSGHRLFILLSYFHLFSFFYARGLLGSLFNFVGYKFFFFHGMSGSLFLDLIKPLKFLYLLLSFGLV
jgi:hypothetical protein